MADRYAGGEPIAEVIRSGFVEGLHRGSIAVVDADGDLVLAVGDVVNPIFPRSANKPLQAVGMLRAGLGLAESAGLALVCGSHRGQPIHLAGVRALLGAAAIGEDALRCPPDRPLSDPTGELSRIHHNCSGKHTGMLLTCHANGWPLDTYTEPDHPLQRALRCAVEDVAGERVAALGVDGCGAPIFALPLRSLAVSFLNLVRAPSSTRRGAVAAAMRERPEMVSGTDANAYDTVLMRTRPGLLAKGGAEGIQVVAVPGAGAVAIKVDDGMRRPLMPVLRSALRHLDVDIAVPAELVYGGGRIVGEVRSVPGGF